MRRALRTALALAVAVGAGLWTGAAHAVSVGITVGGVFTELAPSGSLSDIGDGELEWTLNDVNGTSAGLWSVPGVVRVTGWSATLKEDPFVTNNLSVINISSTTQTFVATVLLPISPFAYSQIIDSSVGATTTDVLTALGSPDGAALGPGVSGFVYTATINGSPALSLFPGTISCGLDGCTTTGSDPLGPPFSGPAGPGVATSIGITLQFTLGPGDSAGITSRFEIVPEPATLVLLGGGLFGLAAMGRRRV